MQIDPRHRNKVFDNSSIAAYAADYASQLKEAILSVDGVAIEAACGLIEQAARDGRRIYVAGNGGSAAIADHLCCDWTKGTNAAGHPVIKTTSFSSNVALYSAVANDYGFEQVFSTQVEFFGEPGDVLVAISSSGNSPNIVAAVQTARERQMATIGLSGFGGGKLAQEASVSLHVLPCGTPEA